MRHPRKKTLAALACLAALTPVPSPAAYTVGAPTPGSVGATAIYMGTTHNAVDIAGSTCQNAITTGIVGSLSWNVTINSPNVFCNDSRGFNNEVTHAFATGYTFRLRGLNNSAGSYDRTCDRCNIGTTYMFYGNNANHPLHLQYDRYGTRNTSWYSAYTSSGEGLSQGEVVGYLN